MANNSKKTTTKSSKVTPKKNKTTKSSKATPKKNKTTRQAMNEDVNDKKDNTLLVIIGIIALIIVLFVIFRLTYAYFAATVKELNPTDKDDAVVSTAKLEVEYVDGDSDIDLNEKIAPDTIIRKEFSVKNNGTAPGYYAIVLENIVNEFTRPQDIKYTLEKQDGTPVSIGSLIFPKTSDEDMNGQVLIASEEIVEVNETNHYVLIVTYENLLDEDQSDDMGKRLEAKINIIESETEMRSAYPQVEYLEGTGTQYIDTEVYAESGLSFSFKMSLSKSSSDQIPVGAIGPEIQRFYPINYKENGYWEIGYNYFYKTSSPIELNTPYIVNAKLYKDYQYLSFNGQETYTAKDSTNIKTTTNIYLFADNYTGKTSAHFNGKIYYCKIWKDNTLIRDFIPVLDKDKTPCMYDKVEKKLYYNKGTESFGYEFKNY